MKTYSLSEIKTEMQELSPRDLSELCLKLARYKKDNKEYLAYLLFSSSDKDQFTADVKAEIEKEFELVKQQSVLYYAKKTLRKILRMINKYCKYLDSKVHVIEIHIHYLKCIKDSGIPFTKSKQITNLYQQQLAKVHSLIETLHEDLQGDFASDLDKIKL